MASLDGPVDGDSFPAVNATRELNLGVPEEFPVDPISSDVETSKKLKKEAEARKRAAAAEEAEKCQCCFSGPLGTTLTVAVVVAAAVGVAFVVTKKLKHT